ncbi:MAG: ABC transporter permease [Thermoproteota archaeon]
MFFKIYRKVSPKRTCLLTLMALGILLFATSSHLGVNVVCAEEMQKTKVYGYVLDYKTHQPIFGARIAMIRDYMSSFRFTDLMGISPEVLQVIAETNSSGLFEVYVESFKQYTFFASYDNMSTPGFDYVPAYKEITVQGSPCYIFFSLLPGASINFTEDPFFSFDESLFSLRVIDEEGLLELTGSWIQKFETRSGTEYRIIAVPANVYKVLGGGFWRQNLERTANFSIPPEGDYFELGQGEQTAINLRRARVDIEAIVNIPNSLYYARSMAEKIGVLSSYESLRISHVEDLLSNAQKSISRNDYVDAQANLYEAHVVLNDVKNAISGLFQNSVISIYFITPFVGVTSSALGAILFKEKRRRVFISLVFYAIFVTTLLFAFPGYALIQTPAYNPLTGTPLEPFVVLLLVLASYLLGFVLINGPYTYGEVSDRKGVSLRSAMVTTFSLAADNLKRRKLRTVLTMIFMLMAVLAFIIATSYSYEEGFVVEEKPLVPPAEGIFLFQQAVNRNILPFGPFETQIIQWLKRRSEVMYVIPLLENVPQIGTPPPPLGFLFNSDSSQNYTISGVLGLIPSLEAKSTMLNRIIDSSDNAGRFLRDDDVKGILISQEASEALRVSVNDTVRFFGRDFVVVGIFDSKKLSEVKDLNGESILPQQVRVVQTQGGPVYLAERVLPEQVLILLSEDASKLPLNIVVSRVNVLIKESEEILPLARALVLIFPRLEAYTAIRGEIKHLYVGYYHRVSGFTESTVLLVLMILNVGAMMLNVVYERRREVVIMSTIGLNPSQITSIFACEALVMAFIAGSVGYFFGLTSYAFFSLLPSPPVLKYKVEAVWSILALCFSISASVLGSIIPASKASILATPSLLKRFIVTPKERTQVDVWTLDIPIKLKQRDVREFFDFVVGRLRVYNDPIRQEERVDNIIHRKDSQDSSLERIHFVYKYDVNKIITENELFSAKDPTSDELFVKLSSKSLLPRTVISKEASARQTASFVRRIILEYTEREKIWGTRDSKLEDLSK